MLTLEVASNPRLEMFPVVPKHWLNSLVDPALAVHQLCPLALVKAVEGDFLVVEKGEKGEN